MDSLTFDSLADVTTCCVIVECRALHQAPNQRISRAPITILNPNGMAIIIAVGLDAPIQVEIAGHVGYYAAGMNQQASVIIWRQRGAGCG